MSARWSIRPTHESDRPEVLQVVAEAMDDPDDVALVERIWESPWWMPELDLVAEADGQVVGHVLHSLGTVDGTDAPAVAPLAVRPSHQRLGIGTALLAAGIELAEAASHPLVIVTGEWDYYARAGFQPAVPLGIHPTNPDDFPDLRAFMVRTLSAYAGQRGTYRYSWQR